MFKKYDLKNIDKTKYIFFTGKGGVGKTSTACATAVYLADSGKKVFLVSTDPASNLQDVFEMKLDNKGKKINGVPGLVVANFDPEVAALEYKEKALAPYIGKLPKVVLDNMEEQLSGSCTVEIAAFNEFTGFLSDKEISDNYDHIIFDTAPTGHTLRMLELPAAWSSFIDSNTTGASCLGQLSGLKEKQDIYKQAVDVLRDSKKTSLYLVTRPEVSSFKEANRAYGELKEIGITNQMLIINGLLENYDDTLSEKFYNKQRNAIKSMPESLNINTYYIPLKSYNITGINNIRLFLNSEEPQINESIVKDIKLPKLSLLIEDLIKSNKKIIFTMGKGGVGKTTIASAIATGLAEKGLKVHLATTDPAAHVNDVIKENDLISISSINEKEELENYKKIVMEKAAETLSKDDLDYLVEELSSPCTQEIAVFRAFADIVDKSEEEIVVIDTAPTGHTLLLIDATQNYHKQIEKTHGETPESVMKLLPKLRDKNLTEVIVITHPEATPVYEAKRLEKDLKRAGINNKWWVVNSSLYASNINHKILKSRGREEAKWINEVNTVSNGNYVVVKWQVEELKDDSLKNLLNE